MQAKVDHLLAELDRGRGFLLARGHPLAGLLLGHVRDIGADPNDPSVRLYRTKERLG
jgi:hypothetical protein